ncbi:MAG: TonB-dependent receptor [Pseudomonadota bacterium]
MAAIRRSVAALMCVLLSYLAYAPVAYAEEEPQRRVIEEMVVTAEKRESTVSDTSISITAFGEDMIEDFGLQGADELVNFIPATTRDAYDIRVRGVGRNFRALGGDPGVATYYNGIYSEDFGIAASENGLYDVQRIEVLRGPQGTLYGRNSIGGALNYITNRPTYEFEGELRTQVGSLGSREYYGILSGPIIADKLAYRVVGVMRDRDGSQDGLNGSEDINTIDDENFSIALQWNISDNLEAHMRWNDRSSDRIIGQSVVANSGVGADRGAIDTTRYTRGLRLNLPASPVTAATPGAFAFTDPVTGAVRYGAYARPGVDQASTVLPNPAFGLPAGSIPVDPDYEDLRGGVASNNDNNEKFVQNGVQFELSWDINDTTSLKYLGGWSDFDYTFDIDLDNTNGTFTQPRQTVLEAVETSSHELQLLWQLGDNLEMTSGVYLFTSDRLQNFAFRDSQTFTSAFNYGGLLGSVGFAGPHTRRGSTAVGSSDFGLWEGDPTGAYYEYWNKTSTKATAVYTQGTYTFNDEFALVVGLRWAEDEKSAFEDRTGYFEGSVEAGGFGGFGPGLQASCAGLFGFDCGLIGLTPLAIVNVFTGAANPTFNALDPIVPTCPLGTPPGECSNRLVLGGIPFSFADRARGDDTWGDTSFRVNLDWTPNEDTLVYASVTTGYRAGGYSLGIGDSRGPGNFGNVVPLTYDQEEVIAYEVGYKGTLLDGTLQLNLSAYLYDYENYQDRVEVFDTVANAARDRVDNADAAENSGFEFEVNWLATDNLTIGANGSYTKTKYKDDAFVVEDDNPFFPIEVFSNITPDDRQVPDAFLVTNLNGNPLKRIPEWKATLWGSYEWRFEAGTLTAGATYAYTGEYYTSGIERDLDLVPERTRLDMSVTWRDNRDRIVVRAFVDNVFDEVFTRGIGTGTSASNYSQFATSLYPRYYGVDMTYRFGAF